MIELAGHRVGGLLFDKDGTLLDFHRTWDRAVGATLRELAPDRHALEGAAAAVGFDLERDAVEPGSPIVAESNATIMGLLARWIDPAEFESILLEHGVQSAHPVEYASELLDRLAAASVALGLITNDSELVARRQIEHLGWAGHFGPVIGYDSGFGAKPDAGPVLEAVRSIGVDAAAVMMVGDSRHDVDAAHAAGIGAVYVGPEDEVIATAEIAVDDLAALAVLVG